MSILAPDSRPLLWVMLAVALFGVVGGSQKVAVSYNGAITYLAATGHQAAYSNDGPFGEWAPASSWQAFWQPGEFPEFRRIAADLAATDIHPPLYFWLLHAWIQPFGSGLFATTLLNLLLLLIAVPLLYGACSRIGCSPRGALLATSAWALGGATVAIGLQARQYGLLSLCAIAFFRAYVGFAREPSTARVVGLGLIAAAGLLTHYHFALLLAAAGLHTFLLFARSKPSWVVALAAASGMAVSVLAVLHPGFLRAVLAVDGRGRDFGLGDALERAGRFIEGMMVLLVPAEVAGWAAIVVAVVGCALVYRGARLSLPAIHPPPGGQVAWFLGGLTILSIGLLYTAGQSPSHASGAQYIAVASPMLYAGMGHWLDERRSRWSARTWQRLSIALGTYFLLYGARETLEYVVQQRMIARESVRLAPGPVVIDSWRRGDIPVMLWHADFEALVFAASQSALLAAWPEELRSIDRLTYVNVGRKKSKEVLERFRESGFEIEDSSERIYRSGRPQMNGQGKGIVYRLRRAPAGSPDSRK